MANTFKFGNGNWAVKDGYALAYNDVNNNFKPLPFDFTRASSATRVNKQGLVETVPSGKPRIDFLNNTSGHLLLEPSRTNLVTYSESFSNWSVISSGVVVTDNTTDVLSPSGKNDASKVEFNAASKILGQSPTLSGNYSGFIYVKGTQGETIRFNFAGTEENFTLTGGWDKLERTNITASANAFNLNTFGGATARTIYVYGAQAETGSYATSYIPTEGSSVTRSAETCNQIPPSSIIGQTEGSAYFEYTCNGSDSSGQRIFVLRGSSTADRIAFFDQAGKIRIYVADGGGLQLDTTTNVDTVSTHKVAFRYKLNDFKLYIDGTAIVTDATFTVPTLNSVYVGTSEGFGGTLGGNVSDVKLYDTALSDSELQALTS